MGGGGIGGGGAGANGPAGQPQADPPLPPPGTAQLALPPSLQNLTISMEGPSESQEDYWQTRLLPGIAWAGAPKLKMLSVDTEAAPLRLTEAHLLLLGMGCAQLRELHLSSVVGPMKPRAAGSISTPCPPACFCMLGVAGVRPVPAPVERGGCLQVSCCAHNFDTWAGSQSVGTEKI